MEIPQLLWVGFNSMTTKGRRPLFHSFLPCARYASLSSTCCLLAISQAWKHTTTARSAGVRKGRQTTAQPTGKFALAEGALEKFRAAETKRQNQLCNDANVFVQDAMVLLKCRYGPSMSNMHWVSPPAMQSSVHIVPSIDKTNLIKSGWDKEQVEMIWIPRDRWGCGFTPHCAGYQQWKIKKKRREKRAL